MNNKKIIMKMEGIMVTIKSRQIKKLINKYMKSESRNANGKDTFTFIRSFLGERLPYYHLQKALSLTL